MADDEKLAWRLEPEDGWRRTSPATWPAGEETDLVLRAAM